MVLPFRNEPFTDFSKEENKKKMEEALKKVKSEFGKEYGLYIDGKWVKTSETFKSINPGKTDEVIGILSKGSEKEAEDALQAALKAFEWWRFFPPEERAIYLFKAAELMRKRKYEFISWLVYEIGKNWAEADGEVAEAIDFMEYYGRQMLKLAKMEPDTPYPNTYNEYFYIPLGVGVVIPPWNFGLSIMVGMTVASIVTGNTVVLKPASDSPVLAVKFVELMEEVGLPAGVLNLVTGPGGKTGSYLVKHPKTRFIAFTGSKDVGCWIYEEAAKVREGQIWLKRVIAEMGGKDAIIVDNEANLESAVKGVVVSAYGYQGQKCSAASRVIVHQDVYDKFVEMLIEEVKKIEVGLPEENYFMGPVINESAKEKILGYIEIGKSEAKLVLGGKTVAGMDFGYYIEPTVFIDVSPEARIAQEEIFGPVLAVIKAKDFDEAIKIANNTVYGLTGSVYTLNREKIIKAKREFHVGNLYINRKCTGALVGVEPFGGFNMSGTDSKAGGPDYLLLFMQAKSVSERLIE